MAANLLNPWAVDSNGRIISIEHATKGQDYTCPKCGEHLSYCQSGTGPIIRRNHFKHKADSDCVGYFTPHETESYIHKTAKERIYNILHSCLENGQPFSISWKCPTCNQQFGGNILYGASDVRMENIVDSARSDVALLDYKGNEIVAIEIVYTHDVEQNTLLLYEQKSITLVCLNFHSVEDLNDIEQKLHTPDSVNICLNAKCNVCQSSHLPRQIIPLPDNEGNYAAVAVSVINPFDEKQQPIWGIPFNDEDKQNAIAFVRRNWPNTPINLEPTEQMGLHLERFIAPRPVQRQIQATRRINPYGSGLDELMAKKEQQNYMIRKSYAQRSKKSGGKRRR